MYIPRYSYASPHADVHALDLNLYEYIPVNHFTIRDCCNGLLLCIGAAAAAAVNEDEEDWEPEPGPANYYVVNPATKKWVMVPADSPAAFPEQHDVLAYDPTLSEDRIPAAKVINLPSLANHDKPSTHRCLGKWRLILMTSAPTHVCYIDYNKKRINVWVDLEDASRKRSAWVLKRALSVEMLVRAIPRASRMENPSLPVTFHGDQRAEEIIVLELPEGVLCFNLRTSRVQGVYPIDYLRIKKCFPLAGSDRLPFLGHFPFSL